MDIEDREKMTSSCRVCLDDCIEEHMFDLFSRPEKGSTQASKLAGDTLILAKKVAFCCGVQIRESDNMPKKICFKCLDLTRVCYNFRQMCINTQVYLESLCDDRIIPDEIANMEDNEGPYLQYLLDELQTSHTADERLCKNLYDDNDDENDNTNYDGINECDVEFSSQDEWEVDALDDGHFNTESSEEIKTNENQQKQQKKITTKSIKVKKPAKSTIKSSKGRKKDCPLKKPTNEKTIPKKKRNSSYMCSECGNVYTKKTSFNYHMKLHSNIKPYECEICGKAYRQVCELKIHMRRHTGEKPFQCVFCDRRFHDRSEKIRHERVHTNTRPYACNICDKSFVHSFILKNHQKLHSGEKNFNCLPCQKAFTLKHQLTNHLKTETHKQKATPLLI